jgi:hypothetical protein
MAFVYLLTHTTGHMAYMAQIFIKKY